MKVIQIPIKDEQYEQMEACAKLYCNEENCCEDCICTYDDGILADVCLFNCMKEVTDGD